MKRNLKRFARQMDKYMNVSVLSMRNIVKKDLWLSAYNIRKKQHLTLAQMHKRHERARFILGELKTGTAQREIVASDEKIFTIEATVNDMSNIRL